MKNSLKMWLLATASAVLLIAASIPAPAVAAGLNTKTFLERELECLAKNIYYEAGSEPFEGKVAVAQVTVNRSESDNYPDSICSVVHQKTSFASRIICQFSWVCNSRRAKLDPELYQESKEVAEMVLLEGFRLAKLKDALYFHATHVNPGWNLTRVGRIGSHVFYKPKTQR